MEKVRKYIGLILFITLLFLNFATAAPKQSAEFIHAEVWKDKMKDNLSSTICDRSGYFRNCYEITEDKCLSASQESVKSCLQTFKLPKKINPYGDGLKYAYKVGLCAGKKIDQRFKSVRRDSEERCVNGKLD